MLQPKQFMKQYNPGEYAHKWRGVSSNRQFLAYSPIEGLIEDVEKHGIKKPVKVYKDMVVDGHHRVIAAAVTNQPIPFKETKSKRYEDQYQLVMLSRLSGNSAYMPSADRRTPSLMPKRLKQYMGYKK